MKKAVQVLNIFLSENTNIKPEPTNISGEDGRSYSMNHVQLVAWNYMNYEPDEDIFKSHPHYSVYLKDDNRWITNFDATNLSLDEALKRLETFDNFFIRYPIGEDGKPDSKLTSEIVKLITKYKEEDKKLELESRNKLKEISGMDAYKGFYAIAVLNNFGYHMTNKENMTDRIYVIDYDKMDFNILGRFKIEYVSTDVALKMIKELNDVFTNKKVPSVKALVKNPKIISIANKYNLNLR